MLKDIIYYSILLTLITLLVTPFILQWILKKALKKLDFNIRFAGLFSYRDIRLRVNQGSSVFQSLRLSIDSITLKKMPKKFALVICMRKPVIQLGIRALDLFITGNTSNLQRLATNNSEDEHIAKNSLEILNLIRDIYAAQTKAAPKTKKAKEPEKQQKKKSLNDNSVFFKKMFGRLFVMTVMKLLVIEVTDCEFEIAQVGGKLKEAKPMFKLEIGKYNGYFEYQKTDSFLMNNQLRDGFMYLRNDKEHKLDLITSIEAINLKLDLPLAFRIKNSILKSKMETNLDTLEVNIKDEHLQAFIILFGNFDLAKGIISLCLKQIRKLSQPEQFESEVNLMKKNLRIKKTLVPVMPSHITVAVNTLKITLPLKLSNTSKSQDVLYDEEILKANLKNFVVTIQMIKQEEANHPSKFTLSVGLATERLTLNINSMMNELVSIQNMELEVETYIQKVKGEALHHKGFRNRISFNQTSFELHYCFFPLVKKVLQIEQIQLTYKMKNYKPLIKYIFKNRNQFLHLNNDPQKQAIEDQKVFSGNFMETIFQATTKEEDLSDTKILSQEFALDVKDLHLRVSDVQKSFVVDLTAKDLVYKNFRQEDGTNFDDVSCGRILLESQQEFGFPLLASQEFALHLVGEYMDEKEARNSIDLVDVSVRLNDFIVLKLISIFDEYAAFFKKVGFIEPPKKKKGWTSLKTMLSKKLTELMEIRNYKSKIKEAQMHVQLRKISAQYDYLEKYAMRLQVDEVQKHSEKISSILNYPTITNFSMDFLKLDQGENQVPMRVFDLSAVTINKEFLRRADGKLDFANYTFKVSLLRPTIIVPNAFVELGAFIKLLALSIITITNHIKKDRPVQPPKKDDLTNFNSLSCDIAFTIRNFKFTLEDSWRNYSLTKFQYLIRNHLSKDLKKDSYELMTHIANLAEIPNSLLSLDVGTACFVLGKYDNQGLTVEDLISKIKTLDKNKFKLKPQYFSSIKALALSFTLTDVSISMRDYVTKILNLKKLDFGGYIINCLMNEEFFIKDSASLKKTFYSLGLTLSSIDIGYGLCYSPATNEIVEWIKKCLAVMKTVRKESQADPALNNTTNDSIIQPPSKNSISSTNSWDTWRYQTHGIFEINVPHKVKLIFVTSLFPYTPESLLITLENFHLVYHKFLQMTCERVMIKRNPRPADEGHLVNIPKVELIVRLDWKCSGDPFLHYTNFVDHERDVIINPFEDFKSKNLEISIFLNVPYGKDVNTAEVKKAKFVNDKGRMSRFMAKNSGSPFFYFQTEFVDWIISLPSLRYDMLRLYRINVNKYSDESEQDADGNPRAEGIYSDYMELIKHTLNAQLNTGDEDQNVLMQISKINFKVHVGATRVVYSNLKAPLKVEIPNEAGKGDNIGSGEEKHILGLQGVIDNMTISCCFYQKQNTLNPATLRKLTKKKRSKYNLHRKVWKIKETLGKLNLLYLSTFDGLELLELKPKEFASNRRNSQHITLDNLQAFREFFNINTTFFMDDMDKKGDAVGQSLINNLSSPVLQPTKLIRASSVEDPLATPMAAIKNIRSRHFNFEEHVSLSRNDSSSSNMHEQHSPPLQEIIEEEDPVNITKLQDFEYSGLGIFFKADLLIYEQDKAGIVEDDEMIMSDKDMIENFFTIAGSKLLITFHLKDIVNHFISAHKTTKHTLKIRSRLPKKKASSKGDDSTVHAVPSLLVDDEWILKNLQNNIFKSAKKEITKKIKFVINIEKPQFNLQYMSKDSQMLLASRKNCMITFYQFQLPFDTFGQDLKYLYKICFNKLECFVAPMNIDLQNKNAFWLEEDQLRVKYFRGKEEDMEGQYEPREGLLLRIISCNKVFFNYTQFKLDKCEIDFSKEVDIELNPIDEDEETHVRRMKTAEFDAQRAEHMKKMIIQQNQAEFWKDEPRINGLSIKADELISYSDSSGFRVFRNVMEFIVLMISSSKIKMKALEIQKGMLNELKHVGKKVFSERIKEKISEREKIMSKRKSNIEYSIRKGSLYLTKDESPFINVSLNDMKGLHMIYDDDSTDYILEVKALEIVNLNESQSEYKMILTKLQSENPMNQNENLMFYMRTHYYYVPGVLNASHKWKVYENFEFKFSPIMIKLTEDIYHRIYEFVFEERFDAKKFKDKELLLFPKLRESLKKRDSSPIVDKKEANDSGQLDNEEKKTKEEIEIDKEAKRLPSFYRYARIGDLKVEFSFKSSSFIKRLNHVKVLMSAFTKYSKFWTTKKLFDSFEKHVIRQSVSQAFSILSQKMGISNKEIQLNEESADKELERKKKMLLGTK